jgi:hypothetical protein
MPTASSLLSYIVVFGFVVVSPAAGALNADATAQPQDPPPSEQNDDSREPGDGDQGDGPFDWLTLFDDGRRLPLLRISPSLYFQLSPRDKLRAQKNGFPNPDDGGGGGGGGGGDDDGDINPPGPPGPPDPSDPNDPKQIPEPAHLLLFAPAALLAVRRWKRRGHA